MHRPDPDWHGTAIEPVGHAGKIEGDAGRRNGIEATWHLDRRGKDQLDLDAIARLRDQLHIHQVGAPQSRRKDPGQHGKKANAPVLATSPSPGLVW